MTLHRTGCHPGPTARRGREATLSTMDHCTKCGLCQMYCPVSAVTERFPGPKYTGPQAQRFRIIEQVRESAPALCSGCGVCTSICPNDVAITDIINIAKADMVRREGDLPFRQRLLNRPDQIGQIGGRWPSLSNALLANGPLRWLAHQLLGIDRDAPLPRFHGRAFRHWLDDRQQPDGEMITYFQGCAVEHYDPEVGKAAVGVLNHLGYRVEAPSDACCGLPLLSSGEWEAAEERAERLIGALAPLSGKGRPVISTSTSCSLTVRSKYGALLDKVDGEAEAVADAMVDICEYLRDAAIERLAVDLQALPHRVLYHGPCQLRGHGMGLPAVELLRRIPGLDLVLSRAVCCGVAGTYGYDRDKRDIAVAVGADLFEQIDVEAPDFVICDSETCRWNIEAMTGRRCLHPIEVLAAAVSGRDPLAKQPV